MARRSAYQAALDLLARRDHFRRELQEKLRKKDYSEEEIDDALTRCEELGLIDDERFAARFVEVRAASKGWGPYRLAAELHHRGLSHESAERMAKLDPRLLDEALRTALRRLEVRRPDGWWEDGQRRARMVSSLIRRGFAADDAMAAVNARVAELEKPDDAPDEQPRDPTSVS